MVLEPQNEIHLQDVAQIAFTVRNLAEAKSFYGDVLELKFLFEAGTMAFFQCGSVRLMIGEAERPSISEGTIVYFRVADLERFHASPAHARFRKRPRRHDFASGRSHEFRSRRTGQDAFGQLYRQRSPARHVQGRRAGAGRGPPDAGRSIHGGTSAGKMRLEI